MDNYNTTADGRNPAPVGRWFIPPYSHYDGSVSQLPVVTINITHNLYHDINIVIDIMILLIYY